MSSYAVVFIAPCLLALAVIVAVIRAPEDHLLDMVRAITRIERQDDDGDGPPPLPKP